MFAARGKRLCCRPRQSDQFCNHAVADPDIQFGEGHDAPKAPRSSAEGMRIKAPSGASAERGRVSPSHWGLEMRLCPVSRNFFSIFYFKRRVLVDSDVLNVPVAYACIAYFHFHQYTVLELRPGMPGISPALVTLVPGTATAEAIPTGDTVYPRLCEIVSDNYGKSY